MAYSPKERGAPMPTHELRFASPPVRMTRLILFFQPSGHVQASHISALRETWRSDYPEVIERPPQPDADGSPPFQLLDNSPAWPLPYTHYHSIDGERCIAFQEDRFEISWEFREGSQYPGFDSLLAELKQKFSVFTKTLEHEADIDLEVTGSECRYENLIEGIDGPELAVGLLTDWTGNPSSRLPGTGYIGVRLHACAEEQTHHCSSLVAADCDTDEEPVLSITVKRAPESGSGVELGGIEDAHQELIEIFERYTSSKQHVQWGRIQ